MKKVICIGMASLIITSMTISQAFSDVSDKHWAKDAINNMVKQEIISGHTDGTFKPAVNLKKMESIILLSKAAGVNKYTNSAKSFLKEYDKILEEYDISDSNKKFIAYLLGINILSESELKNYISKDNIYSAITREEIAILVTRILGKEEEAKSQMLISMPFDDIGSISAEAKPYVQYLYNQGIMKGVTKKTFCPKDKVTRAQIAVILNSIISKINIVPHEEEIVDNTQANITITKGEITDIDTALSTIEIDYDDIYEYDKNIKIYIEDKAASIDNIKLDMKITKAVVVDGVIERLELNGKQENNVDKKEEVKEETKEENSTKEVIVTGEIVEIVTNDAKKIILDVNKKETTYKVVATTKFYQAGEQVTIYDFNDGEEVTLKLNGNEIKEMYYASEIETEIEKTSYKIGIVVKSSTKKLTIKLADGKEETIVSDSGCKIIDGNSSEEIKMKEIEEKKNIIAVGAYEGTDYKATAIIVY